MPINTFSVGKDVSLTVNTPTGQLRMDGLTDFSADPMFNDIKSKGLNGKPRFAEIPDGWKGSFKLDRLDPSIDIYFAQLEAAYYAGNTTTAGTILETINEADGSITQWRYTGVVLKLDKAGDWNADKKVEQEISFMAATKVKVA